MTERGATFGLNKLVRDNLPDMMRELGQEPEVTRLEGDELIRALIAKVAEELAELDPSADSYQRELADLQQAMTDLINVSDPRGEVESLRQVDLEKRGGFVEGQYIRNLHLRPDDSWIDYYRREPGKFPEITETQEACVFCDEIQADENIVLKRGPWKARWDKYPITPGHVEIVPLRHAQYLEQLADRELSTMMSFARDVMDIVRHTDLVLRYEEMLLQADDTNRGLQEAALKAVHLRAGSPPDAFNLGINDGPASGQSVPHFHLHLMPRWKGDMQNPRGGVRNLFQNDPYRNL